MSKWTVICKGADFNAISARFNIDPVVARVAINRDVKIEDMDMFFNANMEDINSPYELKDIEKAADYLADKISEGRKIRVIGDYDCDGICSTYIFKNGLKRCGAIVDSVIPHRINDGYGLNKNLIDNAYRDGIQVIVTCDNGISAISQIEHANELGMEVVVTDHHEVRYVEEDGVRTEVLPNAIAVVDPKQEADESKFKEICGAVVVMKLMEVIYTKFGLKKEDVYNEFLEIATLATVADLMELRDENRIIVKYGLQKMKETHIAGLKALIEVNNINKDKLSAYHLGFIIAPCFNATGRLEEASLAVDLLDVEEYEEAKEMAIKIKELNDRRKELTLKGTQRAFEIMQDKSYESDTVLVIYLPECHESLAGIIAGRIKEKYHKPTFVITDAHEGLKGSGRSIEAYNMFDELIKCEDLFTKFGGHKMAAGLSIPAENLDEFRKRINRNSTLEEEDMQEKVSIDVAMPLSYVTERLVEDLEKLEPFGVGNRKPIFAVKNVTFLEHRLMGKNSNVFRSMVADEQGNRYDLIYFGDIDEFTSFLEENYGTSNATNITMSIVYYPDINEYQGGKNLQIIMTDYKNTNLP